MHKHTHKLKSVTHAIKSLSLSHQNRRLTTQTKPQPAVAGNNPPITQFGSLNQKIKQTRPVGSFTL
ncbi:hypothetical protein HanIR_Chr10g0468001 [Helianthus annuus]|nr:hypothetical protein HanIR_Chr10g0468001 [Helianthus annuus]